MEEPFTKQNKLKPLPKQRDIFKEVAEPEQMFQTRVKFVELLEKIKFNNFILDPTSVDMLSRMLNNKYWFNSIYNPQTEETLNYLLNEISKL